MLLHRCVHRNVVRHGAALLLVTVATSAAAGFQEPSTATGEVTVESVSKVYIATATPAFLVSYRYAFSSTQDVHIEGLGNVPPSGAYHHLVAGNELTFRDAATKAILKRLPLVETVIVASRPPLNVVPRSDEFPSSYRSFPWSSSKSLLERANTVLGKYFNYLPREDNQITYLMTTYTSLQLPQEVARGGVIAHVSLAISFPHDVATGRGVFRVYVLTKEGRTLSDELRPTANPDILAAANKFVDRVVAELSQ